MGAVDYESFSEHFNPRPPCGGRQSTRLERELAELFQSTPPVWGATSSPSRDMILDMISIHAPRVGGDRRAARYRRTNLLFQSTPLVWGATGITTRKQLWK